MSFFARGARPRCEPFMSFATRAKAFRDFTDALPRGSADIDINIDIDIDIDI